MNSTVLGSEPLALLITLTPELDVISFPVSLYKNTSSFNQSITRWLSDTYAFTYLTFNFRQNSCIGTLKELPPFYPGKLPPTDSRKTHLHSDMTVCSRPLWMRRLYNLWYNTNMTHNNIKIYTYVSYNPLTMYQKANSRLLSPDCWDVFLAIMSSATRPLDMLMIATVKIYGQASLHTRSTQPTICDSLQWSRRQPVRRRRPLWEKVTYSLFICIYDY